MSGVLSPKPFFVKNSDQTRLRRINGLWPHFTQNFIIFRLRERGTGGEIYRVITIHYSTITDTQTEVWSQGKVMDWARNMMRRRTVHFEGSDSVNCFGKDLDCKEQLFLVFLQFFKSENRKWNALLQTIKAVASKNQTANNKFSKDNILKHAGISGKQVLTRIKRWFKFKQISFLRQTFLPPICLTHSTQGVGAATSHAIKKIASVSISRCTFLHFYTEMKEMNEGLKLKWIK